MVEQLFGSKTRVKLLQLFLSAPEQAFYVREITRKVDEQINSVRRELANLLAIGIISSDSSNNRLYYQANHDYEHFRALTLIFGNAADTSEPAKQVHKKQAKAAITTSDEPAVQHPLTKPVLQLGHLELALLSGRFTRDRSAPADLLLVGDLNQTRVDKLIAQIESEEKSEIRYAVLSRSDWEYRLKINDRFASTILQAKSIVLVDKQRYNARKG